MFTVCLPSQWHCKSNLMLSSFLRPEKFSGHNREKLQHPPTTNIYTHAQVHAFCGVASVLYYMNLASCPNTFMIESDNNHSCIEVLFFFEFWNRTVLSFFSVHLISRPYSHLSLVNVLWRNLVVFVFVMDEFLNFGYVILCLSTATSCQITF